MKLIDLLYKMYNNELKENTLLKLTYDNWNTIEYWRYSEGKLYYTNEKNDYFRNEPMDLYSYLADRNILIKIIEDKPKKIEKIETDLDKGDIVYYDNTESKHYMTTNRKDREVYIPKINWLIDKVNYLLEESDKE